MSLGRRALYVFSIIQASASFFNIIEASASFYIMVIINVIIIIPEERWACALNVLSCYGFRPAPPVFQASASLCNYNVIIIIIT